MDLRVPSSVLQGLSEWALVWAAIEPAAKRIDASNEYDSLAMELAWLTAGQRAILSAYWLDCEVRNGGFRQYLSNSTGGLGQDAAEGFALLGGAQSAAVVKAALTVIPGLESRSWRYRRNLLERGGPRATLALRRLDESYYAARDAEPLEKLSFQYVQKHWDEFVTPEESA
jgi:Domain of unknown function (DUF4375)